VGCEAKWKKPEEIGSPISTEKKETTKFRLIEKKKSKRKERFNKRRTETEFHWHGVAEKDFGRGRIWGK